MDVKLSERDVQNIIESVLKNIEGKLSELPQVNPSEIVTQATPAQSDATDLYVGKYGVFEDVQDAIQAAFNAQQHMTKRCTVQDREQMIAAIRQATLTNKEVLAKMILEETKLGKYEHKVQKLELTANKTPGTEDLKTEAFSGDAGLTIVERGPFGVIGAVTPVTNPVETIICNTIGMIAAGNAVVFNVHPSSKKCAAFAVTMLNKAIMAARGPENLVTMVKEPTKESLDAITKAPEIRLLVGTGGPGLVKMLLSSGKKAVGAGAGNPPVVVDETANIENAAKAIIDGASFENNILCIAEKEVFVVDKVADDLIFHLLNNGAYMLDSQELEQVMSFALETNDKQIAQGCSLDTKREYHTVKDWIGKDATRFLDKLGVNPQKDIKLLICEVDFDHPFVQLEQMMPVLPIVRVKNLDEAITLAVKAEHGNRHTALMHSTNVDNLTQFARAMGTTIFVKNASSLAGVGFGGEGHTTMTIAGPTGEGLTSARTFTRHIRCVLAEGGFRIIG